MVDNAAKLTESRDRDTGRYLERIALYSTRLAKALRSDAPYRGQISFERVDSISLSTVLHDIGKVGLEDSILNKTGCLPRREREGMQIVFCDLAPEAKSRSRCPHERKLNSCECSAGTRDSQSRH